MADVKNLTIDTSREDYFYHKGFQDGYKAFRNLPNEEQITQQLTAVTRHAWEQVAE